MSAMYLLLRNNKQTGPFSLEALLQHHLQGDDLIWIEGQSAGWHYPSEISALKSFVNNVSTETAIPKTKLGKSEQTESQMQPEASNVTKPLSKDLHIYVSLP